MSTKKCSRCGKVKPLSAYSPGPAALGRHSACKECRTQRQIVVNRLRSGKPIPQPRCRPGRKASGEYVWPRALGESLLDLRSNKWRYPVSSAQLAWRT